MTQLHSSRLANHRPYADVYADSAARLAATGFVRAFGGGVVPFAAEDLYKKVLQLNDASEWVLTAITPTWVQVSGAGSLANDSITNALLANMAQATIKGRASGAGTGDPTDLSASQVKTVLAIAPGDVTGFDTQVRTSRLDQMAAPTADVSLNTHKLTNVTDPGSAQDAATKAYVDSQVSGGTVSDEHIQDVIGAILVGGEYDDGAGTLRVGYLEIPQNSKSADYTAVLSDQALHLFHPVGDNNPRTFTIPANGSVAFRVGTAITFVNKVNVLTIAITSDTLTWAEDGSTGSRSLAANGIATALKITSTEWLISGTGLS